MSKILFRLTILVGLGAVGCAAEPESVIDPDTFIEADNGNVAAEKETFKQRVEARLKEFELRLENLRDKVIDAPSEIRTAVHKDVDALKKKKEDVHQRLAEMWQNGSEKWEEERIRVETAVENLEEDIEKVFSHAS